MNTDVIIINDFNNIDSLREVIETEESVCLKIKDSLTEITQDEFIGLLNVLINKESDVLCSNEITGHCLYIVLSFKSVDNSDYYFKLLGDGVMDAWELKEISNSKLKLGNGYYKIPENVRVIYREHSMSCYNFIYEVLSELGY